jgi:dihydrofolate reductase
VRTSIFVAAAENDVIGRDGDLPWRLPADLRRFRGLTTGHVVVVGRRTQESIVRRLGHPLADRITVVVTRHPQPGSGAVLYEPSVPAALSVARAIEAFAGRDEVFVIGGAEVYAAALSDVDRIYLTRVHAEPPGDVTLPAGWLAGFDLAASDEPADGSAELRYSYQRYERN